RAAIESSGVTLDVHLPKEECTLFVDPTRTGQVISNVLNNAVKFSGAPARIMISAVLTDSHDGTDVVLKISDDGEGISASMLPRIFDLFVQGDQGTSRSHGGLGIGLALARTLIEMHGGAIEAHSDGAGHGSTFTIRIPSASLSAKPTPAEAAPVLRATGRRVLVVDDNEDSAEMLAMLVRNLGGEARTVFDGEAAIREAADFDPHIVLLDIGLPGIDGYETCRRIRAHRGAGTKMVAITGWGQEEDKLRAMKAGFDRHLTKPANPVALELLLAEAPDPNAGT
ncbi:MAG TPA: ATP-binding protein, partial [Vicinamibacterales bacterium]|nr:ATP-binding protein [Vicinamibacterales bacterium]